MRNGPLYNMLFGCTPPFNPDDGCLENAIDYRLNQSNWVAQNKEQYNPLQGGASLSDYKVFLAAVDPHDRGNLACTNAKTKSAGDLCTILENFKVLVPDTTKGGAQEYLVGTPAANCGKPGILCFTPRAYTYRFVVDLPLGVVAQSIYSACPSVFATEAAVRGTPAVTIKNEVAVNIEWGYRWIPRGRNDTLDALATLDMRQYLCVNSSRPGTHTYGGTLAANAATTLMFPTICALWSIELWCIDGASATWKVCRTEPVTFLQHTDPTKKDAVSITLNPTFNNDEVLGTIKDGAAAITDVQQKVADRLMKLELALTAVIPPAFQFAVNITGLENAAKMANDINNIGNAFNNAANTITSDSAAADAAARLLQEKLHNITLKTAKDADEAKKQQQIDSWKAGNESLAAYKQMNVTSALLILTARDLNDTRTKIDAYEKSLQNYSTVLYIIIAIVVIIVLKVGWGWYSGLCKSHGPTGFLSVSTGPRG